MSPKWEEFLVLIFYITVTNTEMLVGLLSSSVGNDCGYLSATKIARAVLLFAGSVCLLYLHISCVSWLFP